MDDFFGHLAALGAEHERLQAENTELRQALATRPGHDEALDHAGPQSAWKSAWATPSGPEQPGPTPLEEQQMDVLAVQPHKKRTLLRAEPRHGAPPAGEDKGAESPPLSPTSVKGVKGRAGVFDIGDMKEKMKAEIMKTPEEKDVARFYKISGCSQAIARHPVFENTTMTIIVIYAIWMAIDTDHNKGTTLSDTAAVFIVGDQFFCTYFTVELIIRFLAFANKRNCLNDAWFVFDSILVVMMVAETWVLNFVLLGMSGSDGGSPLGDISLLRLVRLARLTRLLRMARLLRLVPELIIMVKAITAAARSVGFAMLLLLILIYVFGIAFASVLKDTTVGEASFPSVLYSMHSLVIHGAFCDDINGVFQSLIEESYIAVFLLYVVILLAAVTVMNMLIGILCEVITAVGDAEREAISFGYVRDVLQRCLAAGVDKNDDGCIDQPEFLAMLQNQEAVEALQEIDVDVLSIFDYMTVIFGEDGDAKLPFAEFMDVLLSLRGGNSATVKDIVDLRKWLTHKLQDMEKMMPKTSTAVTLKELRNRDQKEKMHGDSASPQIDNMESISLLPGQMPMAETTV